MNDFQELRKEKLIQNTDFFSSQIKIEKHKPVTMRLSREFIENFLGLTLQNRITAFELTKLTELEIKILNGFCEFVYKKMKEFLIPSENLKLTEKSDNIVAMLR